MNTLLRLHLVSSARIEKPAQNGVRAELSQFIHFTNTSEALLTLGWPGSEIMRKHEDTCSLGAHRLEGRTRTRHEKKALHIHGRNEDCLARGLGPQRVERLFWLGVYNLTNVHRGPAGSEW